TTRAYGADRGAWPDPGQAHREQLSTRHHAASCSDRTEYLDAAPAPAAHTGAGLPRDAQRFAARSEEHTSELQSRFDLVCRLLLEKKKTGECADPEVR